MARNYKFPEGVDIRSSSSLSRIFECPGSVALAKGLDNIANEDADSGTNTHELLAQVMTGEIKLADVEDLDIRKRISTFISTIEKLEEGCEHLDVWVEQSFQSKDEPGHCGTPDYAALLLNAEGELVLNIVDYKDGVGVTVNAQDNAQLISYATLIFEHAQPAIELLYDSGWIRVFATIVQPRAISGDEVQTVELTPEDRVQFWEKYNQSKRHDNLKTGDHCQFCPVAEHGKCPELNASFQKLEDTVDGQGLVRGWTPPLSLVETWQDLISKRPALRKLLDRLDTIVLHYMHRGVEFPQLKPVNKRAQKRWIGDPMGTIKDAFEKRVREIGIEIAELEKENDWQGVEDQLTEDELSKREANLDRIEELKKLLEDSRPTVEKLRTPTQLIDAGFADVVEKHWSAKSSGLKVVPIDAKEKAVDLSRGDDFAELPAQPSDNGSDAASGNS